MVAFHRGRHAQPHVAASLRFPTSLDKQPAIVSHNHVTYAIIGLKLTGSTYRSNNFSVRRYMADRSGSGWMLMMSAGSDTAANFLSDDTATENQTMLAFKISFNWLHTYYLHSV